MNYKIGRAIYFFKCRRNILYNKLLNTKILISLFSSCEQK